MAAPVATTAVPTSAPNHMGRSVPLTVEFTPMGGGAG
eukprot:CAMPEP_0172197094 /NCGR_PEP_ID=MMETSP1050-20130122/27236_1 /TAXON_ID=233186 /ORGANISM="Cryptomonas curvata, Strain CCAP979/52" /LENGTH=36 /DNA_ID= /DNA_START= /DNA_END= /DNA_ORIENTATION=